MADRIILDVKGLVPISRKMRFLGPIAAVRAVETSLFKSGQEIITRSKKEFVPIDTGSLRTTLDALDPETSGGVTTVMLVAGGPSAPYAAAVHETNKAYRNGKQWKYLETPAKEATPKIISNLKSSMKAALKSL